MAYFIRLAFLFQFYTLVFFAVSEFSVTFVYACYSDDPIYCNENPPDSVVCEIRRNQPNSTLLGNALTYCTEGKPFHRLLLFISDLSNQYFIEIPLNVSDNITSFEIETFFEPIFFRTNRRQTVRINPLKQHINLTRLLLWNINWDMPNMLSSYFPNLQWIFINGENSIKTIDNNLFRNLISLSYLSWWDGFLVNISEDCFRGLSSLSYVDLRYNQIPYLSSETFQHLPALDELIVWGSQLNCTCRMQWMSIVDSNHWIEIVGGCKGSSLTVDSPLTYSQCHNTESYQCFNKSVNCETVCINTASSYICACAAGYGLTLIEAEQACHDIDECVQNISLCEGMHCRNTLGSYQCYCEDGFLLATDGSSCHDIDECTYNPCEQDCNNTLGSYICYCYARFVLSRDKHTCQCQSGYELTADRTECVDVDECLDGNGGCDHICINTNGSYTCACYVNSSLTSANTLYLLSPLFISISILQTCIIFALIITLIVTCICWKRGKSVGNKESDNHEHQIYTNLEPKSVNTSKPRNYVNLNEEELRGALTGAAYPAEDTLYTPMKSPQVEIEKPIDDSRYMNLSDI